MNNDELMHYGVLGMKWGLTRTKSGQTKITHTPSAKNKQKMKTRIKKHGTSGATVGALARHVGRGFGRSLVFGMPMSALSTALTMKGHTAAGNAINKIGMTALNATNLVDLVNTGVEIYDIHNPSSRR